MVDDSALVRSLLAEIINRQGDMECIGTANDPLVAREMIREQNPDVITLDVEMPRMDGIDFLGRLMRLRPMPVVMISTLTERGAEVTMRHWSWGGDFVAKPRVGLANGLNELATQIVDQNPRGGGRPCAPHAVLCLHGCPPGCNGAGSAGAPAAASTTSLLGRLSTEKSLPLAPPPVAPRPSEVLVHLPADSPAIVITSICRRALPPALPRGSTPCARSR